MLMSVHIYHWDLNKGHSNLSKSAFLISCICKIDKFPKDFLVVYEHIVFKTIIYVI